MRGHENLAEILRGEFPILGYRYGPLVNAFGGNNVFLVSAEDVKNEANSGGQAKLYHVDRNLQVAPVDESGVSCDLFLASGFNVSSGIPSVKQLDSVMAYLESLEEGKVIGSLVNSRRATLYEDKLSFVDLYERGFGVVETFPVQDFDGLGVRVAEGSLVFKNRLGYYGTSVRLVRSSEDLAVFNGEDPTNWVAQEFVPHVGEIRLLFYGQEMIGSRIIRDRNLPWENRGGNVIEPYNASSEELGKSRDLFRETGAVVGCVDLLKRVDGTSVILEFNGAAFGYGYPGGPYDCNSMIADNLRRDFS